ncbi:DUF4041 domain-containing protein [Actinomadura litoris]|uniref:DUF4041 domain-containing protein n=1 Tax=Actinomadura litoris TaxID=2678616 RepID=A0A7K1L421_9ACTN|nr:DUF4041 domain-containing protein [Actinomadura litoris]MUN39171.1 DUF4041 domain-containing protein [Actinomadura litoris]
MTLQNTPHPEYVGAEVDPGDSARILRLTRLFLKGGETVLALATTVKALPTLTHVAVTDRRILGFAAAELAKEGPRQEILLTDVASVDTRKSYKERWFLVVQDGTGAETDFGDLHDRDAPVIRRLIERQARPTPPAPNQPAPAPAPAPAPSRPLRDQPAPSRPEPPRQAPGLPAPAPAPPQPFTWAPEPSGWRYNPPPTWPPPPAGWTPQPGWQPDASWPPAPPGWRFWVPEVPLARPPAAGGRTVPAFGRKQRIEELEAENASLRDWLERLGALEAPRLAEEIERLRSETEEARRERDETRAELERLRQGIVETRDLELLQEAGVYEYQHPLADVVAYKAELARVKDGIKAMARNGTAVIGATNWTVNGSAAQGGKMVRDFSRLMLRAYNAEADNLVRTMRPYKLASAIERLDKSAQTIERLGKTMDIRVSPKYREIRFKELRLTADHLAKAEEEKERIRAERERQREEEKVRKEIEREKSRLLKERSHVESALARLEAKGDAAGAADLRSKLADVESAISDVDGRAANVRAGYVYVISNIGAFGERMVKIGMTRRLEPMDRVRELGDASVPFRFDVHALIFSDDAVGLENSLHQAFAEQRVNQVNPRREFFYATPAEVRRALERISGNHLLEYTEVPEAIEFRTSRGART